MTAWLGAAALLIFVVILVVIVVRRSRAERRRRETNEQDLTIDLQGLPALPVPPGGPQLECYGVQVRLRVLVVAPAGRGDPPDRADLPRIVEALIPNLMPVLDAHQPIFRMWPPQLSTTGFRHALFNNIRLPGDHGKNTPWCGVVGRFHYDGRPLLAALICSAETPNGLGEIEIEHEGRWLDAVRVRAEHPG